MGHLQGASFFRNLVQKYSKLLEHEQVLILINTAREEISGHIKKKEINPGASKVQLSPETYERPARNQCTESTNLFLGEILRVI